MGFLDRFKIQQLTTEVRSQDPDAAIDSIINGKMSNGGSVMGISAVFAAVELISNSIAMLPIRVKNKMDIDDNHPVNFIFDNMLMSKFNFIKQIVQDILIHGEGLAYIKSANGVPTALVYCEHGSYTITYDQRKQKIEYDIPFLNLKKLEPEKVLHFYKNSQNGVEGKSIISYAKKIFDLCKYTDTAASDFYSGGCNVNGILTVSGNPSNDEIDKIRFNWKKLHSGDGSTGLAILKQNMKYEAIGSSAADSQMLDSRQFNVTEVARFFNINPVLLGDLSNSSYSTIEAVNLEFVERTLLPYISLIEGEMNRKLLPKEERPIHSIDMDETYLLRGDKTATASYLSTLVSNGIMSINEARFTIGMGPIEGGDKHIIAYTDIDQNTIEGKEGNDEEGDEDK